MLAGAERLATAESGAVGVENDRAAVARSESIMLESGWIFGSDRRCTRSFGGAE